MVIVVKSYEMIKVNYWYDGDAGHMYTLVACWEEFIVISEWDIIRVEDYE